MGKKDTGGQIKDKHHKVLSAVVWPSNSSGDLSILAHLYQLDAHVIFRDLNFSHLGNNPRFYQV
jgi:hypothetical protein